MIGKIFVKETVRFLLDCMAQMALLKRSVQRMRMTVRLPKGYTIPVKGENGAFLERYGDHLPQHVADLLSLQGLGFYSHYTSDGRESQAG